ncbi:MAG: protein kinase [Bryobacteraceae bacterium]
MQQIGRYQVLGELGRGAMGVVYRALDPAIRRTVAIKTIRLTEFVDPKEQTRLRDRLMREAQSAGILSHPNIVTIYDVAEEDGVAYIAMEFVDGPTLERLLHNTPPTPKFIVSVIQQTATALDYAHKRGIVHRDIKPANIMIHEGTIAKIADFGVAKIQSHQMTQAGTILGTPNYMSPEQIQGHPVDGRADQFSLAVIAYELLTGERPFAGESMTTLLFKIVKEEPIPPKQINASLGWPVDVVLKRALSKDPAERYTTCSDFAQAFTNACNSSKNWAPLLPGAHQDLPTMIDDANAASTNVPKPGSPKATATQEPAPIPGGPPPDPKPLRILRTMAVVVLAAGLVSLAMVGAFNYFNSRFMEAPAPKAEPEQPPAAAAVQKPSPTQTPPLPVAKPAETDTPPEVVAPPETSIPKPAPRSAGNAPAEYPARLVSIPAGAALTIDSNPALSCKTPCELNLGPGRHTLATSLAGYRPALRIFELPKEPEITLHLEATTGTVMIRSDPPGGAILVDGATRSERTPAMITLPTGSHRLEVVREGYRNFMEVLDIKDGVITNIAVNWSSKAQ